MTTASRSGLVPWRWASCLPVRLPTLFGGEARSLVDLVAAALEISKGKARKHVMAGRVLVSGVTEYDADRRIPGGTTVEFLTEETA